MNNRKQIVNAIVGILASIFGAASIVTGMIAAKDDRDSLYEEIEDRYGLEPKSEE